MTAILTSTLEEALRLNAEFGYAPIPMEPDTKAPLLRGMFEAPPTTPDAIRDAWSRAQWRMSHPDNPQWNGRQPNIAIHLGASGVTLIDTDIPPEVESWEAACAAADYDPGLPTVLSAGDTRSDGTVKHHDGRHHYFDWSDDWVLPGKAMNIPLRPGTAHSPFLQTGARIAMRPPSARNGKAYLPGGGLERRPLPQFLHDRINEWIESQKHTPRVGVVGETSSAEVAWSEAVAILTLLPEGWEIVGDDRGCEVLRHPGASSDRSGVHHAAGCDHLGGGTDIPLLTLFSTSVGGWLAPLVENGAPVTVPPLTLFARKHCGGDRNAARRALGLDGPRVNRSRREAPIAAAPALGPGLGALLAAGGYTGAAEVAPAPAVDAPVNPAAVAPAAVAPAAVAPAPVAPAVVAPAVVAPAPVAPAVVAPAVVAPAPVAPAVVAPAVVAPAVVAPAPVAPAVVAPAVVAPAPVAPAPEPAGVLTRTAPTRWDAPKLPSPLWEAALSTLRAYAVVPDELVGGRLRTMLTSTKWEREQPLREVHTTPPHLWVSEAAAVWGMSPDVVLPLLRLAALHLEGELLILERVGADDADADIPGDLDYGIPGWLDPTIYRDGKAARDRALLAARPEFASFYIFRITEGA